MNANKGFMRNSHSANALRFGSVLIVLLALLGAFFYVKHYFQASGTPLVAADGHYGHGITCGEEVIAVHYHAHIQLVYNGNQLNMPDNIGIDQNNQCLYWLHVHPNDNGVIHIEAPSEAANRTFYIGDLMAVWHNTPDVQPPVGTAIDLKSTSFFGLPVDQSHPLTIYVDGTKFIGDPQAVPLHSHSSIWLEYGSQVIQPTPYQFQDNE